MVQGHVFTLTQGGVEANEIKDMPTIKGVTPGHGRGVADHSRDEPEPLVQIGDVTIGYRRSRDCVVALEGVTDADQPIGRNENVGVYGGDQGASRRRDARTSRITSAAVLTEIYEPDARIAADGVGDNLRSAVT
jgi:hypothetical protein